MSVSIPTATGNAILTAIRTLIDAQVSPGTLVLYTGLRPSAGQVVTTQVAVVTFVLPKPCAPNPVNMLMTLFPVSAVNASASGLITWARIFDGSGNVVIDGDAGSIGQPVEVQVTNTSPNVGDTISVISATLTVN